MSGGRASLAAVGSLDCRYRNSDMQPDASAWVHVVAELQDYLTIANYLNTEIAPLPHRPNIEKKRDFSQLVGQSANNLKISTVIGLDGCHD